MSRIFRANDHDLRHSMLKAVVLSAFVGALALTARAAQGGPALPDMTQLPAMNGIEPKSAAAFWNSWKLVTVRFRQDNGEQRFIYANDVAWAAIEAGKATFPDGSMFGKIAFTTQADPAFPSSLETQRFSRIQLMLKNSREFPATKGWSYALYVTKTPQANDDNAVRTACHACHAIVGDRDFIFSRPTFFEKKADSSEAAASFENKFAVVPVGLLSRFSQRIVEYFGVMTPEVRYLAMPLFTGSLDESIGPVVEAVRKSGIAHLLTDDDHRQFLFAKPLVSTQECGPTLVEVTLNALGRAEIDDSSGAKPVLRTGSVCKSAITWAAKPLPAPLR